MERLLNLGDRVFTVPAVLPGSPQFDELVRTVAYRMHELMQQPPVPNNWTPQDDWKVAEAIVLQELLTHDGLVPTTNTNQGET